MSELACLEIADFDCLRDLASGFLTKNKFPEFVCRSLDHMVKVIEDKNLDTDFRDEVSSFVSSLPASQATEVIDFLMNHYVCYCSLEQIFCRTREHDVCKFIVSNWFSRLDFDDVEDTLIDSEEGVSKDASLRLAIINSHELRNTEDSAGVLESDDLAF